MLLLALQLTAVAQEDLKNENPGPGSLLNLLTRSMLSYFASIEHQCVCYARHLLNVAALIHEGCGWVQGLE